MKELATLLEKLGLENVKTYIQSGNVVFRSRKGSAPELCGKIRAAIKKSRGFEPRLLLLSLRALEAAIASNPFPDAESEPKTLHLSFLTSTPTRPDLERLERVKSENERFALVGDIFYLHAPDGIGRSRLAVAIEKALGVPCTARNWRTVCKIMALAKTMN
ncbi:MAG: DUF1697 domain-containing protein [Gammaproteobacteria bacterium]